MDCAKIGNLIAALRQEKGFTQKNVADALGVSNKTVSKWKCGLGCPDLDYWSDLSTILGVDMAQMMEFSTPLFLSGCGSFYLCLLNICPPLFAKIVVYYRFSYLAVSYCIHAVDFSISAC